MALLISYLLLPVLPPTELSNFYLQNQRIYSDASFREIIEDLQQASSQFCQWWEQQNVRGLPEGPRVIKHLVNSANVRRFLARNIGNWRET
jgi:hypothetical protein